MLRKKVDGLGLNEIRPSLNNPTLSRRLTVDDNESVIVKVSVKFCLSSSINSELVSICNLLDANSACK